MNALYKILWQLGGVNNKSFFLMDFDFGYQHVYLESDALAPGVQNYRGFRCEWTGYSHETPAIAV
jgi:hypothetical protein